MRRLIPGVLIACVLMPSVARATAHPESTSFPASGRPVASAARVVEHPARPGRPIGTLVVPRLKLRAPIYSGITDDIFDIGLGHWPGTARPGKPGNVVIGGHRTGGKMPFVNIDKMRKGDKIRVIIGRKTYTYTVTSKKITKPTNMSITDQTTKPTLTLFTCHPPHSIKLRYIVRAALTS